MTKKRMPLHPGEFIRRVYIDEGELKQADIAAALRVNRSTLSRLIKGDSDVTPQMALKLHKVLGRTAQSWMNMQQAHSLAKVEQTEAGWRPARILHRGRLILPKTNAMAQ